MKRLFVSILSLLLVFGLWSCANDAATDESQSDSTSVEADAPEADAEAATADAPADLTANFTDDNDEPYTWEDGEGNYMFFRSDGSFAGGGPGGEESMYEGQWKMEDGKFMLNQGEGWQEKSLSFEAEDKMILDGATYNRSAY